MMALVKEHIGMLALILLMDLFNLIFIHDMIYSILLGNMKSKRHRYRNAREIAHQYRFIERMGQGYIRQYITKYVKAYERWMIFKRIHVAWMFLSPFLVLLLFYLLPERSELVIQIRFAIWLATFIIINFCFCGRDRRTGGRWRTRYELGDP